MLNSPHSTGTIVYLLEERVDTGRRMSVIFASDGSATFGCHTTGVMKEIGRATFMSERVQHDEGETIR
jgi:hypothetical protein